MKKYLEALPDRSFWIWLLPISLLVGFLLRSIYLSDVEYKVDEAYMFNWAQKIAKTNHYPPVGIPSGVGLPNPGLSLWVFAFITEVFQITDPLALTRAVEVINCLALIGFVAFILKLVPFAERTQWLWALTIACVNPFCVLFSRKIWAQDLLPAFSLLVLTSWFARRNRWGSLLLGITGLLIGQVHMSGFFYFGGISLGLLLFDRRSVRWKFFSAGIFLGLLPLIPWLVTLLEKSKSTGDYTLSFRFWTNWMSDSFAYGLDYSLGPNYQTFLEQFPVAEIATYLSLILGVGVTLAALIRRNYPLWENDSAFLGTSLFLGMGVLLTLLGVPIPRHYLIVTFPLVFVSYASLILWLNWRPKILLASIWFLQLVITICFLSYIHENCGAPGADYGVAYRCSDFAKSP